MDTRIQELKAAIEQLDAQCDAANARARRLRLAETTSFIVVLAAYTINIIVRSPALSVVALVLFAVHLTAFALEWRATKEANLVDAQVWRLRDEMMFVAARMARGAE